MVRRFLWAVCLLLVVFPVQAQSLYEIQREAARTGWTDELHREAGQFFVASNDLPAAIAHWEAVSAPDAPLLQQMMDVYIRLQRWTDVVDTGERLLALEGDSVQTHYTLGLVLAPADPRRAVPHLEAAAQNPALAPLALEIQDVLDLPHSSFVIGGIFMNAAMWDYAELAFTHAATIEAVQAEAMASLAVVRQQQGKAPEGWMALALQAGAENATVQFLQGMYRRGQDDYEGSIQALIRATALDPTNAAYYAELGTAYRLVFNYDRAEHWLRVAAAMSPNFEEQLAVFYAEEGYRLPPERAAELQAVSDALPQDPDLLAGFGWALFTMGEVSAAMEYLDTALALSGTNAAARYYKAQILAEQGDFDAAIGLIRPVAESGSVYAEDANALLEAWSLQP